MSGGDWKSMFKAIQENDLELVKFYLKSGMDPNYQHPEVWALPISESIRYKHFEITELLLSKGANPILKEMESGITPMELATRSKNQKAIDLLSGYLK